MSNQEIEVKIPIDDAEVIEVRRRVGALGFRCSAPRRSEENVLFDFPDRRLTRQRSAVRLRRYGTKVVLTFKGPPVEDPELKIREEIETSVEDFAACRSILERLGMEASFRYAKKREQFVLDGADGAPIALCIDETPFGSFVEIEGSREDIRAVADRMGWPRDRFVTKNYVDLYAEHGLGT